MVVVVVSSTNGMQRGASSFLVKYLYTRP